MIRKIIESALCISLSQLLVAQQVNQGDAQENNAAMAAVVWAYPARATHGKTSITPSGLILIPKGAAIKLIPLDSLSSTLATMGSTVHFAVAQDVMVGEFTAIRAGTHIECRITKVGRERLGKRDNTSGLRVKEVSAGNSVRLRLQANPRGHAEQVARNILLWTMRGIEIAALSPLLVLYFLLWIPVLANCKNGC